MVLHPFGHHFRVPGFPPVAVYLCPASDPWLQELPDHGAQSGDTGGMSARLKMVAAIVDPHAPEFITDKGALVSAGAFLRKENGALGVQLDFGHIFVNVPGKK